ncbi:TetR/AcrR family transcriptional regulator [Streptomyces sp. MMCC 100]|uniref:TetR/AcrR family transcriptional regulator n=1 Tax=Streptomyces sp. MMCC 100 TaxID=3163555 RepID=UPI0035967F99
MSSPPEHPRGRKRDADATRTALLDAARELFGRHGYEAVTLRDIGERAGADGSLIARYFGSKAALYRSAVAEDSRDAAAPAEGLELRPYTVGSLQRADLRGAPGPLVQALLSRGGAAEVRGAAADEIRTRLVEPLAAGLSAEGADDPEAGAELLVACLVGVIALRTSGHFDALARTSPDVVGAVLESAAHAYTTEAPRASGAHERPGPRGSASSV